MSKIRITIDISAEDGNYENSIREAMKGILAGNRSGRNENDTESYTFTRQELYN